MKKILSAAIAFIIVATTFTSCVSNLEVNVDSDAIGAISDLANNYINQESSLASDTATDKATEKSTEKDTQKDTEKATDSSNEQETDKPSDTDNNTGNNTNNENIGNNENTNDNNNDNNGNNDTENETPVVTAPPTLNINGTVSEWNLSSGICKTFNTASTVSNTKFEVNIPVNEAGEYNLKFDANLGFTRTFTSGSKKASISLPKTVFKVGEPIPVAYSTSGLSTATNNAPWFCITKSIGGVDKYISYQYVTKNGSGLLDVTLMTGNKEDNSVANYVWLPAGEYRLYLIDDSYSNTRNKNYWLHDDPINISIVPDTNVGTTVTSSGSKYGSASVSVNNNIFCQGADVVINYTTNNLTAPNGTLKPWIAVAKTVSKSTGFYDYYSHWDYILATGSNTLKFNASSVNNPQKEAENYKSLPIGSYRIYCLNGSNLQNGTDYLDEPIGINIAPAATLGAKVGSTSILNTNSPYDISSVNKTVTVTAADVEKGYITVSFNFGSLAANTTYFLNVQNVSLNK